MKGFALLAAFLLLEAAFVFAASRPPRAEASRAAPAGWARRAAPERRVPVVPGRPG